MFTKRNKQPELAPDYYQWDAESLLSVFHTCAFHEQRSVVVKVLPAPRGEQQPVPLCAQCDAADRA